MENASDAIIMAGAMLVFVIALSVAMTVFSQARTTIDAIVYASDETNYYEYIGENDNSGIKNRIVGLETVIPTLYKYYKENFTIVFLDSHGNGITLYKTQTNPLLWSGNETGTSTDIPPIVSKYPGMNKGTNTNNISICAFDVDEETARREPWTGTMSDYKENIDQFLKGGIFKYPSGSGEKYNYEESFIEKYSGKQFRETIGEYKTTIKDDSLSSELDLDSGIRNNKTKRVIVYQLVK